MNGQRAAVLCDLGDNIIWTVPQGIAERISISFASVDNTPVVMKLYHVKQGQAGQHVHENADLLSSPVTIEDKPVWLRNLHVSSLDDIVVYASVDQKLAVTINSGD